MSETVTQYGYDNYYENVTSVTAKDGEEQVGQNTLTGSGNESTVTDGKVTYKETYTPSESSTTVYVKDGVNDVAVYKQTDGGLTQTESYYGNTNAYNETTEYDKYGKVLKKGTASYFYTNNDGSAASYQLSDKYDSVNSIRTRYGYEDNTLKEVYQTLYGMEKFRVTRNSATETEYQYNGGDTSKVQIIYDTDKFISPRVTNTKYFSNGNEDETESWKYESYDGFGRVTAKSNNKGKYEYTYLSNGTRAYNQLSACKYTGAKDNTNNFVVLNRSYEYDGQGNISKEIETCSCASHNSDSSLNYTRTNTYTYDSQNRLISAQDSTTNSEESTNTYYYSYSYDTSGRLTSMKHLISDRSMTYDSRGRLVTSKLKNFLLSYTNTYKYDNYGNRTEKIYSIGNLKTKYSWTRGRYLESIKDQNDNVKGSYIYNADGIRYSKTVNGVTTTFYYNGTMLMGEDRTDGKMLRYCYDQEGICGFRYYNGSEWKSYTYVKNPQGDIILIKDDMGTPKVKYTYDPWGNVTYRALNLDGGEANPEEEELAKINPFRYRGYYYDEESKLYYLITRYYDPWEGIFISPDSFEYLDPETIGGVNLYAYCNYNPIMYVDPEGNSFIGALLLGALIGGIIGGSFELGVQILAGKGYDLGKIGLAFLGGAVAGAITAIPIPGFQSLGVWGTVLSYGLTFIMGAAGTLASGAITGAIDFNNGWSIAAGILIGGFANVLARGISDFVLGKSASKIVNQGNKAKSLAVQKLQAHRLNMGVSALKGSMRNAFKDATKAQVMQLLFNANPMFRYGIYSSLNSAFLSTFPYMFNW